MVSFLLAMQFLTILPVRVKEASAKKIGDSMIYFPFIGLLLGLSLWGINKGLLSLNFSLSAVNTILVVFLLVLTGGLHLDGLADTADAFLSGKPKEEMLAIMRDSHVGVMGVLSLLGIILLKIGLLSSVGASLKAIALLLMCVLSRWSVVLAMFFFPYARQNGKAKSFIQELNLRIFCLSAIVVIFCAFAIWQIKGLILLLAIAAFAYLSAKLVSRKISGITGDTLGATIELAEVIVLFGLCILEKLHF
jgi:adenosylcobinamide-GDP ribazoletransferase